MEPSPATLPNGGEASQPYERATIKTVIALMAPNTWSAALTAVPVGLALAYALPRAGFPAIQVIGFTWRTLGIFLLMQVTAILMQSAANALNDWVDFRKGTDTVENSVDLADVPLVSTNVNPRTGLDVAIGCLVGALITGLIVTVWAGWTLLVLGIVGALAVVLYSSGKTPISYLPLGEVVSGSVMGLLIPLATYYALTGYLDYRVLLFALPTFLTIGTIMQTNNTCDIARDVEAGRQTLPILLGHDWSARVMAGSQVLALAIVAVAVTITHPYGLPIVIAGVLWATDPILATLRGEFNHLTRPGAMKRAAMLTYLTAATYVAALLIGAQFNV